jgi:8-oxo-dGTP pyrophosphatase MutT (NUDIX family)
MNSRAEKMFVHRSAVPGTKIKTGVGVLVFGDDGRLLLEKRSDCGMWGLLGGAIDPGESITDAAVREVLEESGFHVEVTDLIGIYSEPVNRVIVYPDNGDVRQLIDIVVRARITGGSLRLSHESESVEFFDIDKLPDDKEIIPPARQPLADLKTGLRGMLR